MTGAEWVSIIGALTTLVGSIGAVAVAVIRIHRGLAVHRVELEAVARAAAAESPRVAEVVDELERTGSFSRPSVKRSEETD